MHIESCCSWLLELFSNVFSWLGQLRRLCCFQTWPISCGASVPSILWRHCCCSVEKLRKECPWSSFSPILCWGSKQEECVHSHPQMPLLCDTQEPDVPCLQCLHTASSAVQRWAGLGVGASCFLCYKLGACSRWAWNNTAQMTEGGKSSGRNMFENLSVFSTCTSAWSEGGCVSVSVVCVAVTLRWLFQARDSALPIPQSPFSWLTLLTLWSHLSFCSKILTCMSIPVFTCSLLRTLQVIPASLLPPPATFLWDSCGLVLFPDLGWCSHNASCSVLHCSRLLKFTLKILVPEVSGKNVTVCVPVVSNESYFTWFVWPLFLVRVVLSYRIT